MYVWFNIIAPGRGNFMLPKDLCPTRYVIVKGSMEKGLSVQFVDEGYSGPGQVWMLSEAKDFYRFTTPQAAIGISNWPTCKRLKVSFTWVEDGIEFKLDSIQRQDIRYRQPRMRKAQKQPLLFEPPSTSDRFTYTPGEVPRALAIVKDQLAKNELVITDVKGNVIGAPKFHRFQLTEV